LIFVGDTTTWIKRLGELGIKEKGESETVKEEEHHRGPKKD